MAESFNLNTFLNEYKTYGNRQYTAAENGKAAMEQRAIEQAQKAIAEEPRLLSLTLKEKLAEVGIGEMVMQQIGETALNIITGPINPFLEYLKENQIVLDEAELTARIQVDAKQMFFAKQALAEDAASRIPVAQRFVYDM
ncbi:hypothetical protein IJO12_01810 [bacterium]|nr:hypothetical protein [bacterium]